MVGFLGGRESSNKYLLGVTCTHFYSIMSPIIHFPDWMRLKLIELDNRVTHSTFRPINRSPTKGRGFVSSGVHMWTAELGLSTLRRSGSIEVTMTNQVSAKSSTSRSQSCNSCIVFLSAKSGLPVLVSS